MKFTSVEVRDGTMIGYVELESAVRGDREKALGRALAEELSQYPAKGHYIVNEGRPGLSISTEVEADDFETLIDKAEKEQKRFVGLIEEVKHLRRMLCVIQRANDYDGEGLPRKKKS